jgi:hypothetical protein
VSAIAAPCWRADAAGLAVLAGLSVLPLTLVQDLPAALLVWLVGYGALAGLALFAWRSERWPAHAGGALRLAAAAVASGAAVFGLSALVVMAFGVPAGFVDAGLRGGVGLALAIALCPCLAGIALAGAVRNALRP